MSKKKYVVFWDLVHPYPTQFEKVGEAKTISEVSKLVGETLKESKPKPEEKSLVILYGTEEELDKLDLWER